MVNYNNSKIYKIEPIESNELDEIYIGATKNKYLSARFAIHKHDYKLWKVNMRTNIKSFDLFEKYGVDNCRIVLLESFNAIDKDELNQKELYYIKKHNNCVNKNIPGRTKTEYYNDNRNKILEHKNIKNICNCGGFYTNSNKCSHLNSNKHNKYVNQIKNI